MMHSVGTVLLNNIRQTYGPTLCNSHWVSLFNLVAEIEDGLHFCIFELFLYQLFNMKLLTPEKTRKLYCW